MPQRPDLFTVNVKAVTAMQKYSTCRQQWYTVKARVLQNNLPPYMFCKDIQMKNTEMVITAGRQICNDEDKETQCFAGSHHLCEMFFM